MSSPNIDEPVDAVITWVDGEDPVHIRKLESHLGWRAGHRPKAAARTRYANRGELEYCVSSILKFAPWVRHIFIVTDEQVPDFWSRLPAELLSRVSLIDHKAIFMSELHSLPTFNSLSIETMLWRIPGLAENFIYFNDDCFLIKPVRVEEFFEGGRVVLRGGFRPLLKHGWKKRLKRRLGISRPTRRTLQSETARLAGAEDYYLDVDHVPHPMRVSTFAEYFSQHPKLMSLNASYRLRNIEQFWPVALANHLELKFGEAKTSVLPQLLYLNSKASVRDLNALTEVELRPDCKFLCAQSLDNASDEFMESWAEWMDKTIGDFT